MQIIFSVTHVDRNWREPLQCILINMFYVQVVSFMHANFELVFESCIV